MTAHKCDGAREFAMRQGDASVGCQTRCDKTPARSCLGILRIRFGSLRWRPLDAWRTRGSVAFVSGHDPAVVDWAALRSLSTIAIFMGGTQFDDIAKRMIAGGWSPETPAIARTLGHSYHATNRRRDARQLAGAARAAASRADRHRAGCAAPRPIQLVRAPAFLRPPHCRHAGSNASAGIGRRVIRTRCGCDRVPRDRNSPDGRHDPRGPRNVRLVIFTSVNGVRHFTDRLADIRQLKGRIAAVGSATKAAIERLRLKVDRVPAEYVAEGIVEAFANDDLHGKRILLPRAAVAATWCRTSCRSEAQAWMFSRSIEPSARGRGSPRRGRIWK